MSEETAWLIEETWTGYVHYVHKDFDAQRFHDQGIWNDQREPGWPARTKERLITKDVNEAMRFPTKEAAEGWRKQQPRWMSRGDQFQVREHMWPSASTNPTPIGVPERLGNTPTCEVLSMGADMLDEAAERLGLKIDLPVVAQKLRDLAAALSRSASTAQGADIPDFLKRQTGELPPAAMPEWRDDDGREGRREGAEEDPEPVAPPASVGDVEKAQAWRVQSGASWWIVEHEGDARLHEEKGAIITPLYARPDSALSRPVGAEVRERATPVMRTGFPKPYVQKMDAPYQGGEVCIPFNTEAEMNLILAALASGQEVGRG